MTKRATFTAAELRRVIKTAREIDCNAVVEVTADGKIRIVPPSPQPMARDAVEDWFRDNG